MVAVSYSRMVMAMSYSRMVMAEGCSSMAVAVCVGGSSQPVTRIRFRYNLQSFKPGE